jgi:F-type H+-transporting ATPase subunit b
MEFDWTTFVLEVVNFLVLVWLLKHFFYRPVLAVIARRREGIEKTLTDARATQAEAQALKDRYEARDAEWSREKDAARAKLAEEIAAERQRAMDALHASLASEREKERVLEQKRQAEWRRTVEEQAIAQGAAFDAKLLARFATPGLESRLIDVTLEELPRLPAEQAQALSANARDSAARPIVTSAFPLDEDRRKAIRDSLSALAGSRIEPEFGEDPELLAGLRVSLGAWVLHANLRDELKFFTTSA